MDPYGGDGPQPDPDSGLRESMWRLELGGGGNRSGGLPERPGKRDCAYYLRTGNCGYGERCRYNHPLDRGNTQVAGPARLVAGEYPERYGQPFCEYYMKTGTCKFGSSCKYHHPRQGDGSVQPVLLNYYGYPLRPGEEECSYFMKTGKCKFGLTCKFHHPQTPSASVASPAPVFYPMVPTPSIAAPQQYPEVGVWQVGRSSSALSGTYMPSSYGPMLFSPRVLPVPGWSAYPTPINEAASSGAQQSTRVEPLYGQPSQLSSSASAYSGSYPLVTSLVGPSTNTQIDQSLPQRPGQPECQFYMRTGQCKYGAACRYHHPPNWSIPATNCTLNPLGLPLRPMKLKLQSLKGGNFSYPTIQPTTPEIIPVRQANCGGFRDMRQNHVENGVIPQSEGDGIINCGFELSESDEDDWHHRDIPVPRRHAFHEQISSKF